MNSTELVSSQLCILDLVANSDIEVLTALAEQARLAGWVKDSFLESLLVREAKYPTGIPAAIPVALPHTDAEHVLKPGLGLALLKNPVEFGEMGNSEVQIPVRMVILLLVQDPAKQVDMLGKLIAVIQIPGWFEKMVQVSSTEELAAEFNKLLLA